MALVPYKNPGDSLTADEWNTIFAAADAILTNYLGGLSPLFFGENGDPRKFFFFNPVVPPTAQLHPLAPAWLASAANRNNGLVGFGYWRQYNHGAITSLVAGLAVTWAGRTSYSLASFTFNARGNNYTVGDILTPPGGTANVASQLKVTAIYGAGQILTLSILTAGDYSVAPFSPAAVTGGTGSNAQLSFTWNTTLINPFAVTSLVAPTAAAWHAAVFPENGYGTNDAFYFGAINLDICLSVLTRAGNAVTFGVATGVPAGSANGFTNSGEVEIVHNYDAIELIVIGSQAFDVSWNKYNAFRVHNFGLMAATVSFPGGAITVPPGGCGCIRRVGSTYTVGYNYFQKMVAGDPRFWALSQNTSNQLCPFNAAALIATLGLPAGNGVPSNSLDLSKGWDMSALYAALLAPPQASSVLFDLLCGFGQVASRSAIAVSVVNGGTGYTDGLRAPVTSNGTGIGAFNTYVIVHTVAGVIVSATISDGGNYTTIPTNPVSFGSGGALLNLTFPPPLSFTGWANLAAMFALAGYTWSYNSATKKATITNSITGPVLVDIGTNLIKFLTGTVHSINGGFTADLSATSGFSRRNLLIANVADTDYGGGVVVHNAGCASDPADTLALQNISYNIADPVQKILDCLNALACALISLQSVKIIITPFGPVLYWEEVYGINKNFDVNRIGGGITRIVQGTNVILGKMFLLVGSFQNFFLPTAPPLSQIHFPRKSRVYQAKRAIVHAGAREPWQTNTGAYTTYEPPQLKRFFESQPIGTEAPLVAAQAQPVLARPDGASYLGPLDNATVPANAAESLLCEVEHYNALASQINGLPATPAAKQINAPGIPTYSPGGVPWPNPSDPANPTNSGYFPRNCFTSWMAPASGPDVTAIAMAALGLTVLTYEDFPDPFGEPLRPLYYTYTAADSFIETEGAGEDYLQGFTPGFYDILKRYRWVTIDDARKLYGRLSIPFRLSSTLAIADWRISQAAPSPSSSSSTHDTPVNVTHNPPVSGVELAYNGPEEFHSATTSMSGVYPDNPPAITTWDGSYEAQLRKAHFVSSASGVWASAFNSGSSLTSSLAPNANITTDTFDSTQAVTHASAVTCTTGPSGGYYFANPTDTSTISHDPISNFVATGNGTGPGPDGAPGAWSVTLTGTYSAPYLTVVRVITAPLVYPDKWAVPPDFTSIVTTTVKHYTITTDYSSWADSGVLAICVLAENVASICAVVLPRNYAYYDTGGTLHVDNSQEDIPPQVTLIDGSGALGPETLITCAAANANLITFPINNVFTQTAAAGSPNVGAGDDSQGAGD